MKKLLSILLVLATVAMMIPAVAVGVLAEQTAANTGLWTDEGNYDLSWITPAETASDNTVTVGGKYYQVKGYDAAAEGADTPAPTVFIIENTADFAGLAMLSNVAQTSTGATHKSGDNSGLDAWFRNCVFYITGDIDLVGHDWDPIGNCFDYRFGGQLIGSKDKNDGTGTQVTVSNMTINCTATDANHAVGMVGTLCGGAIKNIKLENASVTAFRFRVGSFAGQCNVATLENLTSDAAVIITDGDAGNGWDNAAGIAGATWGGVTVDGCVFTGSLKNGTVSGDATAGIVGVMESNNVNNAIKNCVAVIKSFDGSVAGDANGTGSGGILGTARGDVAIDNCYVYANMTAGNKKVGGIVGNTWKNITLNNCQFEGSIASGERQRGVFVGCATAGVAVTMIKCVNTGISVSSAEFFGDKASFTVVGSSALITLSAANCYSTANILYQSTDLTKTPTVVAAEEIKGDAAKTAMSKLDWTETWTARADATPVLTVAKDLAPVNAIADFSWFDCANTESEQFVKTAEDLLGLSILVKACGTRATDSSADLFGAYHIKVDNTLESSITSELFSEDVIAILKANLGDAPVEDNKTEDNKNEDNKNEDNKTDDNETDDNKTDDNKPETPTEPVTDPVTEAPTTAVNNTEEESGCASTVFGGAFALLLTVGAAVTVVRKKED